MRVYKITNTINGKIYIGKDSSHNHHRWYYHRWAYDKPHVADYEKRLYRAFRKYGIGNFAYEVLEDFSDRETMSLRESYWISTLGSASPTVGYNAHGDVDRRQMKHKKYRVKSPGGEIFEVDDMISFCKEQGINPKRLYGLVAKGATAVQNKGWQCVREGEEFPPIVPRKGTKHKKKRQVNSKTREWVLINPEGNQVIIEDLKKFCQYNALDYRCMLGVSAGERIHHKKWKVLSKRSIHEK